MPPPLRRSVWKRSGISPEEITAHRRFAACRLPPRIGFSAITSICIFGAGLDATLTYAFTSPDSNPPDIGVTASAIAGLLPDLIEFDLQISSATTPGLRSLFITNLNNDRAVASGVLEVQ